MTKDEQATKDLEVEDVVEFVEDGSVLAPLDEAAHLYAKDIALVAAEAASDKLATDIVALDLSSVSDITQYFVIATVANNPQMQAVLENIEEQVRKRLGVKPLSQEGKQGMRWVLIDYGCCVVHVMNEEARNFYRLEKLWGDAPHLELPFDMND
jgi:ribosome-associated protein